MIALLTAALTFTVPSYNARSLVDGRPNSVVARPVEAVIYRHRQAPAWTPMRPAMLVDGDVWAATWPSVRTGAAPTVFARVPLDPNTDLGQRVSVAIPSDSVTWFYFVTIRDERGKVSQQSNEVGR